MRPEELAHDAGSSSSPGEVLSPAGGFAEPERSIAPLKPATVPERRLELPFDLKTEPNIKFRGPDNVVIDISPAPWPGAAPVDPATMKQPEPEPVA